jgi:hypothetical protein
MINIAVLLRIGECENYSYLGYRHILTGNILTGNILKDMSLQFKTKADAKFALRGQTMKSPYPMSKFYFEDSETGEREFWKDYIRGSLI